MDQRQSLKYYSTKQPTDKIPQIGLEDVSGEQHTRKMVSKTDTGSSELSVPFAVDNNAHGVLNCSSSHVPCEEQGDESSVRMRVVETVNTSHTTAHVNHPVVVCETENTGSTPAHVDQLASVLLGQRLPPLPKFSGEIDASEAVTGTFQEWLK